MRVVFPSTSIWNRRGLGTGWPLRFRVLPGWRVGHVTGMQWPPRQRARVGALITGGLVKPLRHQSVAMPGTRIPTASSVRDVMH